MNTLQGMVKALLDEVGVAVSYRYPAEWSSFPCMAWYESNNREYAQADGAEYLTELTYVVDVWAESPAQAAEIAARADEKLASARFKRTFSQDLYEPKSHLHHRTMRYRAVTDAAGNVYQG